MTKYKYSTSDLQSAVAESNTIAEVMRKLGIRLTGGSHSHLSRRIQKEGISTAHFAGKASTKGRPSTRKKSASEIFVVLPTGARRPQAYQLRRAMEESGVAYACSRCGLFEWMLESITLDVDHVNGDWLDNRLHNLRFMCPNCHSQTSTFGNKKRLVSTVGVEPTESLPS